MSLVLLVEDELVLAETLLFSIRKLGYQCDWAKTLSEARSHLRDSLPRFVVLDRQLPDGDGLDLLPFIDREASLVLILSAMSSVEERVKGLHAGADDYLPKPFSFHELAARLQALDRRVAKAKTEKWVFNRNEMSVNTPRGWVVLTPLEYKFLAYLIERDGDIVSKDRLLKDVWGFSFLPKTRTVDYLITQLRKRIELEPEKPKHLLTIRGAGVKFVGAVF